MTGAPKLTVGDGAMDFWAALREVYPENRHQRCWVHKTTNVLDKLPKRVQPQAKSIESTFAPIRLRTAKTRNCYSV